MWTRGRFGFFSSSLHTVPPSSLMEEERVLVFVDEQGHAGKCSIYIKRTKTDFVSFV